MSEADVVYSDVKLAASKEKSKEAPSSPAQVIYAEVKKRAERPVSQPEAAGGRSKVTERALLLVLCALLTAAAVGLCLVSVDNLNTKKSLDEIQAKRLENSSLVKPTCLNESKLQTCMDENEALRRNLTAKPCPACETGWDQHGGSCYYFSITKLTWNQSRAECRAGGADLVQIDSEEEQRFLDNRVRGNMNSDEDKFWIGLTDSEEEGKWLWVDGSTLNTSLSFWSGKEPDNWTGGNPAGEDCARMGEKGGAAGLKCWFDRFCGEEQKRICEKAAESKR